MYSPPPLDGFSPPPMSDVSPLREYPPPINGFSENEDDEEELDYDFPIDDAEYDLTGLSDKLKSLEIDKISNLPPREILELQKESSEVKNLCLNGVPLQENGFKCEPPSIISEFKEEVLSNEDITETSEQDDSREPTEVLVNGRDSNEIGDERLSRGAAETETRPDHVCPVSPDNSDSDLNIGEEMVAEESCGGFASEDSEKCIVESNEDIENPEVCTSPTNLSKVETIEQDFGEWTTGNEMSLEDEGWGNFDSGPGEGDEADQHWAQPRTSDPETPDPPLQFDESDDEFGDFGEADTSAKVEENAVQVSDSSTIVKTLETLSEASAQLLLSVFVNLGSLDEETDQLFLDNVVMEENGLFETISNPASCPALDHQWRDSAAHKVIMETLGIDSRVLLDGETWRSSQPRYTAPKHAASLMTPGGLLTPEQASSGDSHNVIAEEDQTSPSDAICPAQFDWNKSGLTNPLAENGAVKNASEPVVKMPNNNNVGTEILKDHMSREAQNILDGLPLLNFMSSSLFKKATTVKK